MVIPAEIAIGIIIVDTVWLIFFVRHCNLTKKLTRHPKN